MIRQTSLCLVTVLVLLGCGRGDHLGKQPSFSPGLSNQEHMAMLSPGLPLTLEREAPVQAASLWTGGRQSLLGDRRAMQRGDILTVVVEIDDKAEISNTSARSRSGSDTMSIPQLFGIPQWLNERLPDGATMTDSVSVTGSSESRGTGSVRRNEKMTLRIAATILDVLPNGVLSIQGSQEVRVNFEMRELSVSGFVRPPDISRQNEITYDKIASARVSYGGRGQISDMQQPRLGQQILDAVLPF